MENEVARRRISTVAAHFAPNEDMISATCLLPMNCSGSLNSVIRRCDNRLLFARQGSASQACFMRQVSTEQSGAALQSSGAAMDISPNASEGPMFSRPARMEPKISNVAARQSLGKVCKLPMPEPPKFAKPRKYANEKMLFYSRKNNSRLNGIEWSPRMNVAESGQKYVMIVEIPGVSISDIRVEVDDQNLTVTGKRSTQCWMVRNHCRDSVSAYHKREISQGPYRVVWPLPANVNKYTVSAEFLDGFLHIIIPKL